MFYKRSQTLYNRVSQVPKKAFRFLWIWTTIHALIEVGFSYFSTNATNVSRIRQFGDAAPQTDVNLTALFLSYFLSTFILLITAMQVYHYVKENELSLEHFKQMMTKDWKKILTVSAVLSVIHFVLSRILVVGGILSMIFHLAMTYVPYLMDLYESGSVFDLLKHSYTDTNGYKWDLFCVNFHYLVLPCLVMLFFLLIILSSPLGMLEAMTYFAYMLTPLISILFAYFSAKVQFAQAYYYEGYLDFEQCKKQEWEEKNTNHGDVTE